MQFIFFLTGTAQRIQKLHRTLISGNGGVIFFIPNRRRQPSALSLYSEALKISAISFSLRGAHAFSRPSFSAT